MTEDLFKDQHNLTLARITEDDVKRRTDDLFDFRRLILENDEMYPGIGRWLDGKVLPDVKAGGRIGYVGMINGAPAITAVAKKGKDAKFCHVKISEAFRNLGLGDYLFVLMALDLRIGTSTIRFTLPEHLWSEKQTFFSSFGFTTVARANRQYRLFEDELYCRASFSDVMAAARKKLPKVVGRLSMGKHSLLTQLLVSLRPENAEKILNGQKSVEIRRRFSKDWERQRATLYACKPVGAIVGEADISRVVEGHPSRIWEHFGHLVGCAREEFNAYVGDQQVIYALVLDNVSAFTEHVPIAQLSHLLDESLHPPQSYLRLSENHGWTSAVSLAAALQSSLKTPRRLTAS